MHSVYILGLTLLVLLISGCTNEPVDVPLPQEALNADRIQVALLGDPTRLKILTDIADCQNVKVQDDSMVRKVTATASGIELDIATAISDSIGSHAKHCAISDLALIAVDARHGLFPVHREHILFAHQMELPAVAVVFTHSQLSDDPEWLELLELEVRELLTAYGWDGDRSVVAYDSIHAKVEHVPSPLRGPGELRTHLLSVASRPDPPQSKLVRTFSAEIYVLADKQAFPLKVEGISAGEYEIIFADVNVTATVAPQTVIAPADSGLAKLHLPVDLSVYEGQRFSIVTKGHLAATGVVTGLKN